MVFLSIAPSPQVYRFSMPVFPSKDDDVITSPYNALLSLNALTEHADCVLPIENQARRERELYT